MDGIISAALEEICARGSAGVSLSSLLSTVAPAPSSPSLRASIWANLRQIPSLQFSVTRKNEPVSSDDPRIQHLEDSERLDLKVVAKEHLRDNFLGLYETPPFVIVPLQRRALERLAVARTNGITQSQLAKELGIPSKDFFYRVKKLECQKLIVREPAVVKTKEAGSEGDAKSSSSVTTNLIFLARYAKHLGAQQRFEINKEEQGNDVFGNVEETDAVRDGVTEEPFSDDVLIKDYLPAMKAVCDMLEKENDKVRVVSDIKLDLGYSGQFGHRAWRSVCHRLKDACLVEEFDAKINEKIERCLRLLKKFSLKNIKEKTLEHQDDCEKEHLAKFGRKFQQTEQLVELPIDHQIYDMIEAEGTKGALGMEVCGRLGLHNKRNHFRFDNLVSKFGVHRQKEYLKKTPAYRFWTSGNLNPEASNAFLSVSKVVPEMDAGYHDVPNRSSENLLEYDHPTSEVSAATHQKLNTMDTEFSHGFCKEGPSNTILYHGDVPEVFHEPSGTSSNAALDLVNKEIEINASPSETMQHSLSLFKAPNFGSCQTRPHLPLTVDGALRKQRILDRLQDEKFVLQAELHRWLVSLEKDKSTTMDRKTLERILENLQKEGRCKCVSINFPAVTNCGHSRPAKVILHPSVPLEMDEIHDRMRSFERQVRGQGLSKLKNDKSVPVLNSVTRTQMRVGSNEKAAKIETMRANGFVLSKMIRAKLLHCFLWGYLSNLSGWDDVLSSRTDSCTYELFDLEAAVDAIPVELFLKVAGSAIKVDDIIKCKRGLCLSDLPVEEYKRLKDTQATGRLSLIIDILRRLKLIRLIRDEHLEEGVKIPHVTFKHAIELKPYIEEPASLVATSSSRSLDPLPRIIHFFLSNREAVNDYWRTLEYCYAAADPSTALHAFPGSAVPEVLRICYDKSQCHKKYQGALNARERRPPQNRKRPSSSKKRKRSLEQTSIKHVRIETENELRCTELSDNLDQFMDEQDVSSSSEHDDYGLLETVDMPGLNGDEESNSLISQFALSKMKPTRLSRFAWTDESDRQLVIQYVRQRVNLGAKFHRIKWTGVQDLPAPPKTCARRIASLKRNRKLRKALMNLCTILSKRYVKHLEKKCSTSHNSNDGKVLLGCSANTDLDGRFPNGVEQVEEASFEEEQWDDFSDKTIKKALEDVLRYKGVDKSEPSENIGSAPKVLSDVNRKNTLGSDFVASNTSALDGQSSDLGKREVSAWRSRRHRFHRKFIKLLNEGTSVSREVHKSLAAANAVELLKLVFLSTSTAPELQNFLAETLRRYSEHDLFAAFSYLRERKIMIGGDGGPFMLSQQFLHSVSKSPFPMNTGTRAAKFSCWLHAREKELVESGIDLNADLQCGDILHLFALITSGEMSISPHVPGEGVGEAEDLRSLKRKADDDDEFSDVDMAKRLRPLADSELFSRREKGFPGMVISVHRTEISVVTAVETFRDAETCYGELHWNNKLSDVLNEKSCGNVSSDYMQELPNFDENPISEWSHETPWESMAGYAKHLMPESSDLEQASVSDAAVFKAVHTAIKKAGDLGLSLEEISQVLGKHVPGYIVDVLQAFGQVLKVNAYDSIRVVDALYYSKYFLTPMVSNQNPEPHLGTKSIDKCDDGHPISQPENHVVIARSQCETIKNDHGAHKGTIHSLPEEVPSNKAQNRNVLEDNLQHMALPKEVSEVLPGTDIKGETLEFASCKSRVPILPWINGDGTVNKVVYHGLMRSVLGTVMQNPGILEEDIIHRIDVLNPQSCRSLLESMVLDKHLITKTMHQSTSNGPPALLGSLLGNSFRESKSVYRKHFFANPMSASML